jgi:hypothetical protein
MVIGESSRLLPPRVGRASVHESGFSAHQPSDPWGCQSPPKQGSSEAMNIHSQTAISPLRWLFRVRK